MEQGLVLPSASLAGPQIRVVGSSGGVPHVVCDDGPQGIGFLNLSFGQQAVVNRFGPLEVNGFAVLEATVGLVRTDVLPYFAREPVFDPLEVQDVVDGIGEIHPDGSVVDAVCIATHPKRRPNGFYVKLYEMQDRRRHGRGDSFPDVERVLLDGQPCVGVARVPSLSESCLRDLAGTSKPEPRMVTERGLLTSGARQPGIGTERPLNSDGPRCTFARRSGGGREVGLLLGGDGRGGPYSGIAIHL